ncbi:MAG TPA: hypothetical protein VJZ51_00460 [Bacilli bacterium]|nr:hypothetical protein [Bacilli bacterium]
MELIINFFTDMDVKLEGMIKPIFDWLILFFAKEGYFTFLILGSFIAVLIIAGLIGMLKKAKFLFFLLLIVSVAAYLLWQFVVLAV